MNSSTLERLFGSEPGSPQVNSLHLDFTRGCWMGTIQKQAAAIENAQKTGHALTEAESLQLHKEIHDALNLYLDEKHRLGL